MRAHWTPLWLLFLACRFDTGGVASDGGVLPRDLAPRPDTSAAEPAVDGGGCGPDAAVCCGEPDGRRVCNPDTNSSAACSGGVPIDDRECPPNSDCEGFVCTLGTPCQVCGSGCGGGQMCSIFVTVGGSNTCCTPCFADSRGCGSPGRRCDVNSQCASGVCMISDGGSSDGGMGQCYYHCQASQECGDGGVCEARLVQIDGLERVLSTCRAP